MSSRYGSGTSLLWESLPIDNLSLSQRLRTRVQVIAVLVAPILAGIFVELGIVVCIYVLRFTMFSYCFSILFLWISIRCRPSLLVGV